MSAKETVRLDALHRVERDEMTVVVAAGRMELSVRQARQLGKRFKAHEAAGRVHRSRGRPRNRRLVVAPSGRLRPSQTGPCSSI